LALSPGDLILRPRKVSALQRTGASKYKKLLPYNAAFVGAEYHDVPLVVLVRFEGSGPQTAQYESHRSPTECVAPPGGL